MPIVQKTNKQRADKHEARVAKLAGGRITKGSGNSIEKGDVKAKGFRIECKTTKALTYRLEDITAQKIVNEGNAVGCVGIMNIQFEMSGNRYVLVSEQDWLDIIGK